MRRWTLYGAIPVSLIAAIMHAGGAAAGMLLWQLGGYVLLRPAHFSWPHRQQRVRVASRRFLHGMMGVFVLILCFRAMQTLCEVLGTQTALTDTLSLIGAVFVAHSVLARAFYIKTKPVITWMLGLAFLCITLYLLFCTG